MNPFKRESQWDRAVRPLRKVAGIRTVRSGLTAGVTMVALSVVSAVTSAARRRQEGSR
jgi:hypothetical protein